MTKLTLSRSRRKLSEAEEKGHKANPPSYSKMDSNERKASAKDVKGSLKRYGDKSAAVKQDPLPAPKKGNAKNLIPDASNVNRSEASPSKLKSQSEKVPAVGSPDKIKGTILQGLSPDSVKKCEIKVAPAVPKPESGFGIVAVAGSTGKKQTMDSKVPSVNMKSISEGVINGKTKIFVEGKLKLSLDAANTKTVSKIIESYTGVGSKVQIKVEPGSRRIFADNRFSNLMMESLHNKHHHLDTAAVAKRREAFNIFKESLDSEYSPFYHASKREWVNETLKPAFRQISKFYESAYNRLLKPFDVTVRAKRKGIVEDVEIRTKAINENCAAANAFDELVANDGFTTTIQHAFVGAKKILPESDSRSPLTKVANFFDDERKGKFFSSSKDGGASSVKADKAKKTTVNDRTTSVVGHGGKKTVEKTKVRGAINPESFVKRNGGDPSFKGTIPSHVKNAHKPLPDSGPIFEEISLDPENLIKRAIKGVKDVNVKRSLTSIQEKLTNGLDLSDKEEKVIDMIMDVVLDSHLSSS
jgi:hypothetical protein